MNDLDRAKVVFHQKGLTLIIVKGSSILFETSSHMISGFLDAIELLGDKLEGASVADSVVGKAIALLFVHARIHHVYAEILSQKAKAVFEENGIAYEGKKLVDTILDANRSGLCPFEKAASEISNPKEGYEAFKALLQSLDKGK